MTRKTMDYGHRLAQIQRDAYHFYKRHGRPDLFEHSEAVISASITPKMLEPEKFQRKMELNERLACVIYYHPLEYDKARTAGELPKVASINGNGFRYDQPFLDELEVFCKVRRMDELGGLNIGMYGHLLSTPRLALLARIADLSVLHDHTVEKVHSFSGDWGIFHKPDIGWHHARKCISNPTLRVHAPFAELLGYHEMVNNMRENAYHDSDLALYLRTVELVGATKPKVEFTLPIVKGLMERLDAALVSEKIEHRFRLRERKSLGSILEKVNRGSKVKDWIAFTVVTKTVEDAYRAMKIFDKIMKDTAPYNEVYYLRHTDFIKHPKNLNGYQSLHSDAFSCNPLFVHFQAMFRTEEMDWEERFGGYAHEIYRGDKRLHGGDSTKRYRAFIGALKTGDLRVLNKLLNQRGPSATNCCVQILGKTGMPLAEMPVLLPSGSLNIDAVGVALDQFSKKHIAVDVSKGLTIVEPKHIGLSRRVVDSGVERIVIQVGTGEFSIKGTAARQLMDPALTLEGSVLLRDLSKIR